METPDIIPIIDDDIENDLARAEIPEILPILPLRNTVLFPGIVIPITIARDKSLQLVRDSYKGSKIIGVVAQKNSKKEDPAFKDLYKTGTVAQIMRILEMPEGTTSVIIQGKAKIRMEEAVSEDPYLKVKVTKLTDKKIDKKNKDTEALIGSLKDLALKIVQLSPFIPPEATFAIKNIESTLFLINFISNNTGIETEKKQKLLEKSSLEDRGKLLLEYLSLEVQKLELRNDIQSKARVNIDQQQREYLLHQQMKAIQNELGGNTVENEIEELKAKAKTKKWPQNVADMFSKDVEKLYRMNPSSAEYSVHLNYLTTLLDLPWGIYTKDSFDITRIQQVLDEDHYGLEKVKERIIEYMAVLKLKGDMKSPILCLYGPPGVGKTSLGKSVARALERKYVRVSLGGLHDEAEIRGHRRTYIGALPGRIVQNVRKAGSSNPVFILDEIDKVGKSFQGDPSSALLEVLDPEQNNAFYDNYLETEYDLSKILFIATANTIDGIIPALRDRMEMIEITGYLVEEKIEIAKAHIIPKELKDHGLEKDDLEFSSETISHIIQYYTRESGVRALDKLIAKIMRAYARKVATKEKYTKKLKPEHIEKVLGKPRYIKELYEGNEYAGVVTGLAWTAVGGEILYVETSLSQGKGKLAITGNLGDVMKESAVIALEYIKAHSEDLDITSELFDCWNVHVHVPEGAIPKDGPSAGITMAVSIASAFTQRKIKAKTAMTGEITLRGRVLPVGGIKEKILAAKRSNITNIVLSEDNKKDIQEINEKYIKGLTFHYVNNIMEVFNISLLKEKVKKPQEIKVYRNGDSGVRIDEK